MIDNIFSFIQHADFFFSYSYFFLRYEEKSRKKIKSILYKDIFMKTFYVV